MFDFLDNFCGRRWKGAKLFGKPINRRSKTESVFYGPAGTPYDRFAFLAPLRSSFPLGSSAECLHLLSYVATSIPAPGVKKTDVTLGKPRFPREVGIQSVCGKARFPREVGIQSVCART